MRKYFDHRLNSEVHEILAGEYIAINKKDAVITTLVGSCVAVCLMDKYANVIGMNHFMLPDKHRGVSIRKKPDLRYGAHSMEILIHSMQKKGALFNRLEAKVFGGGKVIDSKMVNVAADNVEFILEHMDELGIPIISSDYGGNYGRKILFFGRDGKVLMKRIKS